MAGTQRPAKERMYDWLRAEILLGSLHPNQRLPEERLAEQFGLSRTPVREVLARLEAEGLVEQPRFRSARVRHYTPEEIRGTFELRTLLEGYAARQAASQLTRTDLDNLKACNWAFAEAADRVVLNEQDSHPVDVQGLVEANSHLHAIIARASGNLYLPTMLQGLSQLPLVYRALQYYGRQGIDVSIRHHDDLIRALEQREPDLAEAIMRMHIHHGREALFCHLADLCGEGSLEDEGIA